MSAFLCLDPSYNHVSTCVVKDHTFLTSVIERYRHTQELAAKLAEAGWRTEVTFDEGHVVVCRPPQGAKNEEDIKKVLDSMNLDVGDYGYVDYDDDFDDEEMCDGDVSIDDCCGGGCCRVDEDEEYDDYDDEDVDDYDDEDVDDYDDEDVDDYDDEIGVEPLMHRKVAEAITGKKIEVVDLVDDYKVVFHLEGGEKLIFDEDDGVFLLA